MDRASIFIDEAEQIARANNGRAFIAGPGGAPALVVMLPSAYEGLVRAASAPDVSPGGKETRKQRKDRAAKRKNAAEAARAEQRASRHRQHETRRRMKRLGR